MDLLIRMLLLLLLFASFSLLGFTACYSIFGWKKQYLGLVPVPYHWQVRLRQTCWLDYGIVSWHYFYTTTGLPSSVWVVDCAVNGFIGDQIIVSKGDAQAYYPLFV